MPDPTVMLPVAWQGCGLSNTGTFLSDETVSDGPDQVPGTNKDS